MEPHNFFFVLVGGALLPPAGLECGEDVADSRILCFISVSFDSIAECEEKLQRSRAAMADCGVAVRVGKTQLGDSLNPTQCTSPCKVRKGATPKTPVPTP